MLNHTLAMKHLKEGNDIPMENWKNITEADIQVIKVISNDFDVDIKDKEAQNERTHNQEG